MSNRKFKTSLQVLLASVFVLIGVACTVSQNENTNTSIFNVGWVLERTIGGKQPLPAIPIYLTFHENRVIGTAACNGIGAYDGGSGYEINTDKHSLKVTFSHDLRGCDDQQFDGEYMELFGKVSSYRVIGDRLTLLDASGNPVLLYHRDDKYLNLPATTTASPRPIPCDQPGSNC